MARLRPTAILFAAAIVAVVWMSYHHTGQFVAQGLALMASSDAGEVKDGVVQLLAAVSSNMVAVGAVTGLVGALTKLCEDSPS